MYFSHKRSFFSILIILLTSLILIGCDSKNSSTQKQFVVGLATNNPNGLKNIQEFKETMTKLGYIEGDNINYQFADKFTKGDELKNTLNTMISTPVDLIFTAGTGTGVMAHKLAKETKIPIVFGVIADPVKAGVLSDLTQPGGNITGVMISPNQSRRLEYLLEISSKIKTIFILYNPKNSAASSAFNQVEQTAKKLGLEIIAKHVHNETEVNATLDALPDNIDALFMLPDSTVNRHQKKLIKLAIDKKLIVSGPSVIQAEKGALVAYGIAHKEAGGQAASIADQVLKGAPPGEIPVQTADFYLGVNLVTAQKIGVEIPNSILHQAHTVIRSKAQ